MTAARAIQAGQDRLRSIAEEEHRLLGELSEAMDAARVVPSELQRLLRDRDPAEVEAGCVAMVRELLSSRELRARSKLEALGVERRTLEWIVAESDKDSRPPPPIEEQ